jgi:hypothetical protein
MKNTTSNYYCVTGMKKTFENSKLDCTYPSISEFGLDDESPIIARGVLLKR